MSAEIYAFVDSLPTRDSWQEALESLEFPLVLDEELDLTKNSGFSPAQLQGRESGFEIDVEDSTELIEVDPVLREAVGSRRFAISIRFGGDLAECACALAALGGLISAAGAVVYSPNDNLSYTLETLTSEFQECLADL